MKNQDLWETLKEAKKPVVIYGMGDGCDKILRVCREKGVPIRGIFASDEYVREKTVHGFPLKTLSQIREELGDVIALLAFGVFREDLMEQIRRVASKVELYAPEVPLFGGGLFDRHYHEEHKSELDAVAEMLSDEQSKKVFRDLIEYKLTGALDPLWDAQTNRLDDLKELVPHRAGDAYVDLGAYDGDTVLEWADLHPDHGPITAVEPNGKTFQKLLKNCEGIFDFHPVEAAAWKEDTVLCFNGKSGRSAAVEPDGTTQVKAVRTDGITSRADFIKMDVEGAEKEAIEGCRGLIESQKPNLCISAYHRTEDLFAIPLQVKAICPDYRVYLRHTPYIPAWDTFFYFSCR